MALRVRAEVSDGEQRVVPLERHAVVVLVFMGELDLDRGVSETRGAVDELVLGGHQFGAACLGDVPDEPISRETRANKDVVIRTHAKPPCNALRAIEYCSRLR